MSDCDVAISIDIDAAALTSVVDGEQKSKSNATNEDTAAAEVHQSVNAVTSFDV